MAKKKKDLWWYIQKEYGLSAMKRKFTKETGIPTTQAGLERKIGKSILSWIFGSGKKKTTMTSNHEKKEKSHPRFIHVSFYK